MKENFLAFVYIVIGECILLPILFYLQNDLINNIIIGIVSGGLVSGIIALINYLVERKKRKRIILEIIDEYDYLLENYVSNASCLISKDDSDVHYELIIKLQHICKKTIELEWEWKKYSEDFYPLYGKKVKIFEETESLIAWFKTIFDENNIYELYFPQRFDIEFFRKYIRSILQKLYIKSTYEEYRKVAMSGYFPFTSKMVDVTDSNGNVETTIYIFTNLVKLRKLRHDINDI